jgi:uncharacterized integral membrane protein
MPRAFCKHCYCHVNATPGSGGNHGIILEDALPNGTDVYVPVNNPFRRHYCPKCGAYVVIEEAVEHLEEERKTAKAFWPVWIVMAIITFLFIVSGVNDKEVGVMVGLLFGGFVLGMGWVITWLLAS